MKKIIMIEEISFCEILEELSFLTANNDPQETLETRELKQLIEKWLEESLKPRAKMIISLFYGLGDNEEQDFKEIAKEVGCNEGWARNTFYRSKKKLREKRWRIRKHLAVE